MKFYDLSLERRLKRQIDMLLNVQSNTHSENENLSDLFDITQKVVDSEINDLGSPNKELLIKSLKFSKDIFEGKSTIKNALSSLEAGNNNSFLIFPIRIFHHIFSISVRKNETGVFSVILHDKSDPDRIQRREFKFDNSESLEKILKRHYYSKNLITNIKLVLTNKRSVVKDFKKNSISNNQISIESVDQKVGNCFFKEVEVGIKDMISSRHVDMTDISWGTYKQHKMPNETYHKRYIEELLRKYDDKIRPSFKAEAMNDLDNYYRNKYLRKKLRFLDHFNFEIDDKEFCNVFEEAFGKGNFKDNLKMLNTENFRDIFVFDNYPRLMTPFANALGKHNITLNCMNHKGEFPYGQTRILKFIPDFWMFKPFKYNENYPPLKGTDKEVFPIVGKENANNALNLSDSSFKKTLKLIALASVGLMIYSGGPLVASILLILPLISLCRTATLSIIAYNNSKDTTKKYFKDRFNFLRKSSTEEKVKEHEKDLLANIDTTSINSSKKAYHINMLEENERETVLESWKRVSMFNGLGLIVNMTATLEYEDLLELKKDLCTISGTIMKLRNEGNNDYIGTLKDMSDYIGKPGGFSPYKALNSTLDMFVREANKEVDQDLLPRLEDNCDFNKDMQYLKRKGFSYRIVVIGSNIHILDHNNKVSIAEDGTKMTYDIYSGIRRFHPYKKDCDLHKFTQNFSDAHVEFSLDTDKNQNIRIIDKNYKALKDNNGRELVFSSFDGSRILNTKNNCKMIGLSEAVNFSEHESIPNSNLTRMI